MATTIQAAIKAYRERRLLVENENKAKSADTTVWRLEEFFGGHQLARLSAVTPAFCRERYLGKYDERMKLIAAGVVTRKTRFKRRMSASSHHNILKAAKSFLGWCIEEGMIPGPNPAGGVKAVGRPGVGKAQLNYDQANAWLLTAVRLSRRGDLGAVAALAGFLCGLRASEVTELTRQQVDRDFTVVSVIRGKTRRSTRRLEIPVQTHIGAALAWCLRQLCKGLADTERVFGKRDGSARNRSWVLQNSHRVCRAAKVPLVSAHGLRGTHATLAEQAGTTPAMMLQSLGHESRDMQKRAYIAADGATERGIGKRFAASGVLGKVIDFKGSGSDKKIVWRQRGVKIRKAG